MSKDRRNEKNQVADFETCLGLQSRSLTNLGHLIGDGLVSQAEVDRLVNNVYKDTLKCV